MDQKLMYALPHYIVGSGAANGGACGYPGQSLYQAHGTKSRRPRHSPNPSTASISIFIPGGDPKVMLSLYNFGLGVEHEPRHSCAHAWGLINIRVLTAWINKCERNAGDWRGH